MPMIPSEREYRNFELRALQRDEENTEEKKIVRGYASTFDEPYTLYQDDDLIITEKVDRHAFDEADMDDVIFQYNHEGRVFARIRNNTLEVSTDDKGLAIEANLGETEIGRQLYEEIKGGYTDKMSFGFRVSEDKWEDTTDHESGKVISERTIMRISKVYDVSAVSLPANDGTEISVRALTDGAIERVAEERRKALELKRQRTAMLLKLMN